MADGLADLSAPVEDRILILNIIRGLKQRFEHVGSIIQCYSPFSNFLKVQDDLLLEEIHMDSTEPPAATTALYTNAASPTAKPPSSTPSRLPNGGNGGTGGNQNKYNNKNRNGGNGGGNNDKNSNGDRGCGGSSGQTIAPTGTSCTWRRSCTSQVHEGPNEEVQHGRDQACVYSDEHRYVAWFR
jgi:hypothetical protein